MIHQPIDLTGRRFGRLVVLGLSQERTKLRRAKWECRCDCGASRLIRGDALREGKTLSCGCYLHDQTVARLTTHGRARTPEYRCWQQMIQRCYNPKCKAFENYGARGISVCERWRESFPNFLADMGQRPTAEHSIDRIENNGNYEPDNCRWTTSSAQLQNNRRSRPPLTYNGRTMTLTEWAAETGIATEVLAGRVRGGWPAEKVLTTPVAIHSRHQDSLTI